MLKLQPLILVASVTFSSTSSAMINEKINRWYGGTGLHASRSSLHSNYANLIKTANAQIKKYNETYSIFLGHQFSHNIGFEIDVAWHNKLSYKNVTAAAANGGGTLDGKIKTTSYAATAVGFVPLSEKFATVGELSAVVLKTNTYAQTTSGTVNSLSPYLLSKHNVALRIGAGTKYNFVKSLAIRCMLSHQFSARSAVIKYSSTLGAEVSYLF